MSYLQIFGSGGGGGGGVQTLTGNSGGAVSPTGGGTINIIGASGVAVAGNPGTNTLTITASGNTFTVSTVDATPTAIFTQALTASQAAIINASIVGAKADFSAALTGAIIGGARRGAAGGAHLVGAPSLLYSEDAGGTPPEIDINVSGNNVIVYVTGQAATTYNWSANIIVQLQS